MVMPGDNIHISGELITPIAMEAGLASLFVKVAARLVLGSLVKLLNNCSPLFSPFKGRKIY